MPFGELVNVWDSGHQESKTLGRIILHGLKLSFWRTHKFVITRIKKIQTMSSQPLQDRVSHAY